MMLETMMPPQEFVTQSLQIGAASMLGGFGLAVSFWVMGYAVRSLFTYLRGGM